MGIVHQLLETRGKQGALELGTLKRREVEAAAAYMADEDSSIGFLYSGWNQARSMPCRPTGSSDQFCDFDPAGGRIRLHAGGEPGAVSAARHDVHAVGGQQLGWPELRRRQRQAVGRRYRGGPIRTGSGQAAGVVGGHAAHLRDGTPRAAAVFPHRPGHSPPVAYGLRGNRQGDLHNLLGRELGDEIG